MALFGSQMTQVPFKCPFITVTQIWHREMPHYTPLHMIRAHLHSLVPVISLSVTDLSLTRSSFSKNKIWYFIIVFSVHRINLSPTLEYESWMHQVGGNGAIQCYVAHRGQRVLAFICINTFQSYISKRLESASMHICKSTAARHLHPCAQICLFDLWMWGEARLDL